MSGLLRVRNGANMVTPNTEGLSQSSIEAKQTAKGEYQVSVKIYQNADNSIDLPAAIADTIQAGQKQLRQRGFRIVGDS